MVQHFLGTLQLPMAVYMLDYYLPMLSPNEGYDETGLTMQSAGPIREPWQPIAFEFLFKGSEFGHWRVKGGQDAFAFRHPSLGQTEVFSLLASEAHHHKVSPIGTGRLVAMVGTTDAPASDVRSLQILFGLVLAITPRSSKSKDELPAARIHRQCNPRSVEVAFLSGPAIDFFARAQLLVLQDWYLAYGQSLEPIDATVKGDGGPLPGTFFLHTMWMFGCTKPTREVIAVAQTPPCRYHYYTPANLADAMIRLLDGSSNEGLTTLSQILRRGQHTLGQLWTNQLSPQATEDLKAANAVLPGLRAQFEAAQPHEQRQPPTFVDAELLAGTTVNFPRSLVRLAWMLQHAATLLPMAGDIQAVLNSRTAGVSDIHAWGLMLPSSSKVSPVTYHSVVAVRYPDLCKLINDMWELGSFVSGGLPDRPPGFQFVLWDTTARINGLVATDLETLVSEVLSPFPRNAGFADGLFVMTTARDHKNNLNRSVLKKDYARTLRVETIANSAGGTAQVAIVAQPSIGFLNTKYYSNGSPTEDTEDCLGRITVGLTRSKSLTLLVSPLDMMVLMGMAQVVATIAYGIRGLRRGETTWEWPDFYADPEQENLAQMSRWSLNSTQRARYRLILVRGSDLGWLNRDRLQEVKTGLAAQHKWIPIQNLPFPEVVLYAYAADRTPFPTYVCLPSGLYKARTGQVVAQTGPDQEIYFLMDGGYTQNATNPRPLATH